MVCQCGVIVFFRTLLCELLHASSIIGEYGFAYFWRHLVLRLTISLKLNSVDRVFTFSDLSNLNNADNLGLVFSENEWSYDTPKQNVNDKKDRIILQMQHPETSDSVVVFFERHLNNVAETWLSLLVQGEVYELDRGFQPDFSDDKRYASGGLRLECVAPMRRWRIVFNGLLRKKSNNQLVHVKLAGRFVSLSHVFEYPKDLNSFGLADELAKISIGSALIETTKLSSEMSSYEQAMQGIFEVEIGEQKRTSACWGTRLVDFGSRSSDIRSDHHFGCFDDGTLFHIQEYKIGSQNIKFGFAYNAGFLLQPLKNISKAHCNLNPENAAIRFQAGSCTLPFTMGPVDETKTSEFYDATYVLQYRHLRGTQIFNTDGTGRCVTLRFNKNVKNVPKTIKGVQHVFVDGPLLGKPLILGIQEENCKRECLTGGKGSSLAVLYSIAKESRQFKVPYAFVLTVYAYKEFSKTTKNIIKSFMEEIRKQSNNDAERAQICKRTVEAIQKTQLPHNLQSEILDNLEARYGQTLDNHRFAVRSSAVGEDSEDMSAAGQMTTFLGVRGREKLFEAVVNCWASQFSHVAIEYKRQYGQYMDAPMAVVIQEMVPADAAGVMFTCDALTGNPEFITVTANFGLGESVVSASADPDTYVLRRNEGNYPSIEKKILGEKKMSIVENEDSTGTTEIENSSDRSSASCLSDQIIQELGRVAITIEECYSCPRDMEWAVKNNQIYLLQCRPVSSLFKESVFEIEHDCDTCLRSPNEVVTQALMAEILPGVTSPLGLNMCQFAFELAPKKYFASFIPHKKGEMSQYVTGIMPVFKRRYYMSLTEALRCEERRNGHGDSMMFGILGRDISKDDIMKNAPTREFENSSVPFSTLLKLYVIGKRLWNIRDDMEQCTRLSKERIIAIREDSTATEIFQSIVSFLPHAAEGLKGLIDGFTCSATYNAIVMAILKKATGSSEMTPELYMAFTNLIKAEDVESAQIPKDLDDLAKLILDSPSLNTFINMSEEEAVKWLNSTDEQCGVFYRDFLSRNGHRSVREFDLYIKPWILNQSQLIKSLKAAVHNSSSNRKEIVEKKLMTIDELPFKLSFIHKQILNFVLPKARYGVCAREFAKSASIRLFHTIRVAFHKLGERMKLEGRLPDGDLLFFLTFDEINQLLKTRNPVIVNRAKLRQRLHPILEKERYPILIKGIPEPVQASVTQISDAEFKLKGTPVSQGIATGFARVITDFATEAQTIQHGDILVTRATDTGWTPYFPILSGVVTEIGGIISHGAVVAREYGLPAVVGLENVTQIINTGDYLELNGSTGVLSKLAPPEK